MKSISILLAGAKAGSRLLRAALKKHRITKEEDTVT